VGHCQVIKKTQVLHYFGKFDLLEVDVIACARACVGVCVCVAGEVFLYVLKPCNSIAEVTMQNVNVAKLLS